MLPDTSSIQFVSCHVYTGQGHKLLNTIKTCSKLMLFPEVYNVCAHTGYCSLDEPQIGGKVNIK